MADERTELTLRMRLERDGGICVLADASGELRPKSHLLAPTDASLFRDRLDEFTKDVGRAVESGRHIEEAVLKEAHTLYDALFQGQMRDVAQRLLGASPRSPLLVRLVVSDPLLQAVPWEALCEPQTTAGFLGTSPRMIVARGVNSTEPCQTYPIRGTVRVLAIATLPQAATALQELEGALADPIKAGAVEWLPPIEGEAATARHLFAKLRARDRASPHVIHFIGHGTVDEANRPMLRLTDGDDGQESWMPAETLAGELKASFGSSLRLIVLEACKGARPGAFGSAAEALAQAAQAVVAHLWPVREETARICSGELYRTLTSTESAKGDVVASLTAARRTLLLTSAEAFSPVVYLRGKQSALFDFRERTLIPSVVRSAVRAPARPSAAPTRIAPVVPSSTRPPVSGGLVVRSERPPPPALPAPAPAPAPALVPYYPPYLPAAAPRRFDTPSPAPHTVRPRSTPGTPSSASSASWIAWSIAGAVVLVVSIGALLIKVISGSSSASAPESTEIAQTVTSQPAATPPAPRSAECYGVKGAGQQCAGDPCKGKFNAYQHWNCDELGQARLRCDHEHARVVVERCPRGCTSSGIGNSDEQCNR